MVHLVRVYVWAFGISIPPVGSESLTFFYFLFSRISISRVDGSINIKKWFSGDKLTCE